MVFQVEGGLATFAVVHVLFPTCIQHLAVLLRRKVCDLFQTCGTVARKGEHVSLVLHHSINDFRHLVGIHARDGSHNGHTDAIVVQHLDLLQSSVERAGLAHEVVRLTVAVDGELVFLTTVKLQLLAVLIGQVKRIAQNGKRDFLRFQHPKDIPYLRVQKRVASRDIEVRKATAHFFAHFHAAVNHLLGTLHAD